MLRLIDANFNRLREGLRVIEDIARFTLNLPVFEEIKNIRHSLKEAESFHYEQNLASRNSEEDLGRKPFESEEKRDSLQNVLLANFKRVQESLRSLEEVFKIHEKKFIRIFKDLRYQSYTLEKKVMLALKKNFDLSLYLVTDSRQNKIPLESLAEEAILGGVTFIQLREKHLSDRSIIEIAKKVKSVCQKYHVPFIIDDRPDLCMILDLDGIHLGQEDISIDDARRILGYHKIIGKSTHSLEQANSAVREDIDYFAFGPLFKTPTKDYTPVGLDLIDPIREISSRSGIPVVFIGGITDQTIDLISKHQIQSIAVVREIMSAQNPKTAAQELRKKLALPVK